MNPNKIRILIVLLAALFDFGCASAPPAPAPTVPPAEQAAPPPKPSGAVGRELLSASAPAANTVVVHEELVPPTPDETLAAPVYPEEALQAKAEGDVVVQLLVDTSGRIVQISDSPKAASTTGPFAAAFRRAVEQAVRSWQFAPAMVETVRPGKDNDQDGKPDYSIVESRSATAVHLHYRFTFRIVAGQGRVSGEKQGISC